MLTDVHKALTAVADADETVSATVPEIIPPSRNSDLVATDGFDYGAYPADIAEQLRQAVAHIRARHGAAKSALAEIGAELIRVKHKVGHGNWGPGLMPSSRCRSRRRSDT